MKKFFITILIILGIAGVAACSIYFFLGYDRPLAIQTVNEVEYTNNTGHPNYDVNDFFTEIQEGADSHYFFKPEENKVEWKFRTKYGREEFYTVNIKKVDLVTFKDIKTVDCNNLKLSEMIEVLPGTKVTSAKFDSFLKNLTVYVIKDGERYRYFKHYDNVINKNTVFPLNYNSDKNTDFYLNVYKNGLVRISGLDAVSLSEVMMNDLPHSTMTPAGRLLKDENGEEYMLDYHQHMLKIADDGKTILDVTPESIRMKTIKKIDGKILDDGSILIRIETKPLIGENGQVVTGDKTQNIYFSEIDYEDPILELSFK